LIECSGGLETQVDWALAQAFNAPRQRFLSGQSPVIAEGPIAQRKLTLQLDQSKRAAQARGYHHTVVGALKSRTWYGIP
jgi:hypothetical protein